MKPGPETPLRMGFLGPLDGWASPRKPQKKERGFWNILGFVVEPSWEWFGSKSGGNPLKFSGYINY
jgi:hypothetical protein